MIMLTFEGQTKSIAEWAAELHISVVTLNRRRSLGWSTERVLKEKLHRKIEGIAERDKLPDMSAWWRDEVRKEREAQKKARQASNETHARRSRGRDYASAMAARRASERA